jgi:hypothetical protein
VFEAGSRAIAQIGRPSESRRAIGIELTIDENCEASGA